MINITSYLDKYLDDLYHLKIGLKDIIKNEKISRSKLQSDFKEEGLLTPRAYYGMINTGIDELDFSLKQKYNSIVTRCNGRNNNKYHIVYHYMEYIPIYEWVKFCNKNKELLVEMWETYINHDTNLKYAISIDRIDNDKGYIKDNIEFVTQGYNSWKRNIRPISIEHNGEIKYFMSCEEGSKYYGLRRQTIGDLLRGVDRQVSNEYDVKDSATKEVLKENNVKDLKEYYKTILELVEV